MITEKVLCRKEYGRIRLRQSEMSDCTPVYVGWLNDPEVNRYLETRWSRQSLESIQDFVYLQRENSHSILFAIEEAEGNRHIGNIKIGPIDWNNLCADISYFIGEKDCWNRGIATEAIALVCRYGFEELGLRRIEAGAYAGAAGSWRALEKNGFVREGIFRERGNLCGEFMDVYRYGILKPEYKSNEGV